MNYGLEMVTPTKKQEAKLKIRFSLGSTRINIIWTLDLINEHIRGTAQVEPFGDITIEARLRWFGHLQRK